ncbi:hypothetical protein ACTFIT_009161 [Dictyostelium discoideum]
MSRVIHISSNEELDKHLQAERLVIDFSAAWSISPVFEKLSNEFVTFTFVHVDIDKLSGHPIVKEIRSVPTFYFYRNGAKVSEFSGANEATLRKLDKHLKDDRVAIDFSAEWLSTISSLPHFQFYVKGAKVSEFSGANENSLRSNLESHK